MKKYICRACGYVFSVENQEPDEDKIIEVDDMPDDLICPRCKASKANIEVVEE